MSMFNFSCISYHKLHVMAIMFLWHDTASLTYNWLQGHTTDQ